MSTLRGPSRRRFLALVAATGVLGCRPTPNETPPSGSEITPPAETPERRLPALDPADTSTAVGVHGAVASAEANASDVGVDVLRRGGNAVDAAIAVAFALAVTHPSAGNLGGGGFMVVRMADGTTAAIDYREVAPGAAHRDMYLDKKGELTRGSLDGAMAAGIPGTVAGLEMAHKRFGTLPWADLVAPAITLAADGVVLDSFHAEDLTRAAERMEKLGYAASLAIVRKPDGTDYAAGERWKQPALAESLRVVAGDPRAFYSGPFADKLASGVRSLGGIWTVEDLAKYEAIARDPIVFDYRGYQILTMPPPSAGGIVMRQILAASEILGIHKYPWHSVDEVHLYVEAARRTYADRNLLLGDPAFVKVPMDRLLDASYMKDRLADVDLMHATPSTKIGAGLPTPTGSMQTTHFSVADEAGNAVSNTYTLNTSFGSKAYAPGTGILLNNEMDDFAAKPGTANAYGLVQGEANRIEPGKRMLSSMTPTIITKDGKLRAVVGTPGGSTITTTVTQIVRALLDYGQTIDAAVKAPRLHHQWLPDIVRAEPTADPALIEGLRARGHEVQVMSGGWTTIGHANCLEVDPATGGYRAVADVARDGGKASAY
ncbi:MAG: gamma-glutamyltransferase [Nannocystaceae bacterium]